VSKIESRIDGLKTLLKDPSSEYQIIDLNFHIFDRTRWLRAARAVPTGPRIVSVRLIRCPEDSHLTLAYAEEKLQAHIHESWSLLKNAVVLQKLEARLIELRKDKASHQELNRIKNRIKVVSNVQNEIRRNRNSNRYLLYAVRYHLIDPQGKLAVESRYAIEGNVTTTTGNRVRASKVEGTEVCMMASPTLWQHAD
jgi:hypothetical protein